MAARVPTYMPVPNWDIPANSNLVVLGRLIKDPRNPESKVDESGIVPVPSDGIYEVTKEDWATVMGQLRSNSVGLWAKWLQWIGGGLSFRALKASVEAHRFEHLETKYFVPDKKYFAEVLKDEGVQLYLDIWERRKPVYLVTGVKTAKVASVTTHKATEKAAEAKLKVDATNTGAPLELGPELKKEVAKIDDISFRGSTDYIFAYRIYKIKPIKDREAFDSKPYVKGALFDKDGSKLDYESELDRYEIEEETEFGLKDCLEKSEEEDRV